MKRALLLFALLLFARTAFATNYYVATAANGGSDANPGTMGSPKLTIQAAINLMSCGDTTIVGGGTYDGGVGANQRCASYGSGLTLQNATGEVVTLTNAGQEAIFGFGTNSYPSREDIYFIFQADQQGNIVMDASLGAATLSSCVGGLYVDHVKLINLECKNSQRVGIIPHGRYWEFINLNVHDNGQDLTPGHPRSHGIYLTDGNCTVDGGRYWNNGGYGIQIYDASSSTDSNNTVKNVLVYDNNLGPGPDPLTGNGGGGIVISHGTANIIYNAVLWHNGQHSIDVYPDCLSCAVYNTSITDGLDGLVISTLSPGASISFTGKNNIIFGNAGTALIDDSTGATLSNNLFTDPVWASPSTHNYALTAGSTDAIGTGADLSMIFTTDIVGVTRTTWDLGAYAYTGGGGGCTPAKILFIAHPVSAAIGASLGTVTAGIYDSSDVLCTSDTTPIIFAKHGSATWNSLQVTSGTLTKTPIAGIATINTMFVSPTTGSGSITASDGGALTDATSDSITISAVPTDPCAGPPCTFYIDFVAGDDSYSGLDTMHPWKHAPGMPNATGNPNAIATPMGVCHPSDCIMSDYRFIFKGGVTWDDTNRDWFIQVKGTTGHPVYFGVDPTWYTGGSWSRPKFDWGGEAAGCFISAATGTAGRYLNLFHIQYAQIDNFEFFNGWFDSTTACVELDPYFMTDPVGFGYIQLWDSAPAHNRLTHLYIHDWTHPPDYSDGTINWANGSTNVTCASGCTWTSAMVNSILVQPSTATVGVVVTAFNSSTSLTVSEANAGSSLMGAGYRITTRDTSELISGSVDGTDLTSSLEDSVVDGSDSTEGLLDLLTTTGQIDGAPSIILRNYLGQYTSWSRVYLVEAAGNTFWNAGHTNSTEHDQALQANAADSGTFHDNFIYYSPGNGSGQTINIFPAAAHFTFYNNVVIMAASHQFSCAQLGSHDASDHYCNFYNNTYQSTETLPQAAMCNAEAGGGCQHTNEYFIGPNAADTVAACGDMYNTCTTLLDQGTATAESDTNGLAEYFTPKTGGATVGAGTNLSAQCSTFTTLCYASARGVTLNATDHTVTVSVPNPVLRPLSGDWDIGAYQFSASAPEILSASPDHGPPNANYDILITGSETSWDETSVPAMSCAGAAFVYSTTYNASSILATFSLVAGMSTQYCNITMTTGMEVLTLTDGFHIVAPAVVSGGGSTHLRLKAR